MTRSLIIRTSDGNFSGYLALPKSGKGPGLVLAQEIFGVNHVMKQIADAYAKEGYAVFVPDLFWRIKPGIVLGYSEDDWKAAFDCYQKFNVDKGVEDLQAAITALRGDAACTGKVGVIGYCLGGLLAYLSATRTDCDAAIGYYGVGIQDKLSEAKNITCPTVLHFAEKDQFVPLPAIAAVEQALAANPHVTIYRYPGVDHAFAREGESHYDRPSACAANARTLACLKSAIGPR